MNSTLAQGRQVSSQKERSFHIIESLKYEKLRFKTWKQALLLQILNPRCNKKQGFYNPCAKSYKGTLAFLNIEATNGGDKKFFSEVKAIYRCKGFQVYKLINYLPRSFI